MSLLQVLLTAVVGLLGTAGLYAGARYTVDGSRKGVERTADVDAQESALVAWKSLVEPMQKRLTQVEADLDAERSARQEDTRQVAAEQAQMRREMERLRSEVQRWRNVAKTIARWATQLRDEVLRLGGQVPATPEELLTLQAMEEADAGDALARSAIKGPAEA